MTDQHEANEYTITNHIQNIQRKNIKTLNNLIKHMDVTLENRKAFSPFDLE